MDKGGVVAGEETPKVVCGANATVIGIGAATTTCGVLNLDAVAFVAFV